MLLTSVCIGGCVCVCVYGCVCVCVCVCIGKGCVSGLETEKVSDDGSEGYD